MVGQWVSMPALAMQRVEPSGPNTLQVTTRFPPRSRPAIYSEQKTGQGRAVLDVNIMNCD